MISCKNTKSSDVSTILRLHDFSHAWNLTTMVGLWLGRDVLLGAHPRTGPIFNLRLRLVQDGHVRLLDR